jgi:hypothetical protein
MSFLSINIDILPVHVTGANGPVPSCLNFLCSFKFLCVSLWSYCYWLLSVSEFPGIAVLGGVFCYFPAEEWIRCLYGCDIVADDVILKGLVYVVQKASATIPLSIFVWSYF